MLVDKPEHVYSTCFRCKVVRPWSHFVKTDLNLHGYCRECRAEYRREYAETKEGRLKNLLRTARKNAKIRGKRAREDDSHEYSMTQSDLQDILQKQHGLCAVTKIPLSFQSHLNTTVSLDRVDDSLGYTRSNCRLVCNAINAPRRFEASEILNFPLVQRYLVAREAAVTALTLRRLRQSRPCSRERSQSS